MSWDPLLVEARLSVGLAHPEDFPALAADALEGGVDGPATRRLAGLDRPSGWEVDQLTPAFMQEAGLSPQPPHLAWTVIAAELAARILDQQLDPLDYLDHFERMWIDSDYASALGDLGQLHDEHYGRWRRDEPTIRVAALEELRSVIAAANAYRRARIESPSPIV